GDGKFIPRKPFAEYIYKRIKQRDQVKSEERRLPFPSQPNIVNPWGSRPYSTP
ncbi:DPYS isoform 4, partial [Pongo abelii]